MRKMPLCVPSSLLKQQTSYCTGCDKLPPSYGNVLVLSGSFESNEKLTCKDKFCEVVPKESRKGPHKHFIQCFDGCKKSYWSVLNSFIECTSCENGC